MKLTEEEARELLNTVGGVAIANEEIIEEWRKRGWIEKSAVDEFCDYYRYDSNPQVSVLYDKGTKAFEELKERLKNKEK